MNIPVEVTAKRVRAMFAGQVIADSARTLLAWERPRILFETGLPPRFYLPQTDLRPDLLEPSDTVTRCPYKGTAV